MIVPNPNSHPKPTKGNLYIGILLMLVGIVFLSLPDSKFIIEGGMIGKMLIGIFIDTIAVLNILAGYRAYQIKNTTRKKHIRKISSK